LAGLVLAGFLGIPVAKAEVNIEGGLTAAYQFADIADVDSEFSASVDAIFTVPQETGEWLIYLEGSSTPDSNGVSATFPTANADAGSVLNRDSDGGIQVSEFHYTFRFQDSMSLSLGLIDPSASLDRSRIANDENTHFLNGSFVNNATIDFPDYTIGGVLRIAATGARPELAIIVASSDGIADYPDRSYQDLLSLTSGERGAFFGVGSKWLLNEWTLRFGSWLRTDDHAVLGNPGRQDINYGAYAGFGWQRSTHALNLRFGAANSDVSVATRFVAGAYERQTPYGLFGAAVARTAVADTFRTATLENVTTAELFFRIPIGRYQGHVTPSVQYVENPGFDGSGFGMPVSAVVSSVRLHWFW